MLKWLTAGESHGRILTGIVEGIPSGISITSQIINYELRRRQLGYGRGDRMTIEQDEIEITGGIRYGLTTGAPISLNLRNRDSENWNATMSVEEVSQPSQPLTAPRPGHSDFAGSIKYNQSDIRNIIERASARETAMRTAIGAICKSMLLEFGILIGSHIIQIGAEKVNASFHPEFVLQATANEPSPLRCLDQEAELRMMQAIDLAKSQGDTLGGILEVVAIGLPIGLGSFVQWNKRLDGIIAQAMLSIPAMKAIGFGTQSFTDSPLQGSKYHDEMYPSSDNSITRITNTAGGIEGGMTNGEPIVVRVLMKPLSSLGQPLSTVDLQSGEARQSLRERSDVCAVPAGGIVAEAMLAIALTDAFLEKYGGDSMEEMKAHFQSWKPKWHTSI